MGGKSAAGHIVERISALTNTETVADLSLSLAGRGALGQGVLPVTPAMASMLPSGNLERGRIYGCSGDASVSALFALVSMATREGSWLAMVDMDHAGLQAAHEHGVALHRTLCVATGSARAWPLVVGALVDGIDIVAVASPPCRSSDARRLAARVRSSGAVLFVLGRRGALEVDVMVDTRTVSWHFDLHAHERTVHVSTSGRRVHGSRHGTVHLPGIDGVLTTMDAGGGSVS